MYIQWLMRKRLSTLLVKCFPFYLCSRLLRYLLFQGNNRGGVRTVQSMEAQYQGRNVWRLLDTCHWLSLAPFLLSTCSRGPQGVVGRVEAGSKCHSGALTLLSENGEWGGGFCKERPSNNRVQRWTSSKKSQRRQDQPGKWKKKRIKRSKLLI